MNRRKINAITWTELVYSQIPLSYDEGEGNLILAKKVNYKGNQVLSTSVGTVTYELRKILGNEYNWTRDSIVLNSKKDGKISNLYSKLSDVESLEENGLESDMMGYFIPSSGNNSLTKTSPLRIIPFRGIDEFTGNTQIITNRGMIDINDGRKYFTPDGKEIPIDDKFPTTQALAYEETDGSYYVLTVIIELNRVGVKEVKDGKVVEPAKREYMSKELREKAVKDVIEAFTVFRRRIKHSTILLKPLMVVCGAYDKVIPYFCDDIDYAKRRKVITLENIKRTIEDYDIKEQTIVAVDKSVDTEKVDDLEISNSPVKEMKDLASRVFVGEDNMWYIEEK